MSIMLYCINRFVMYCFINRGEIMIATKTVTGTKSNPRPSTHEKELISVNGLIALVLFLFLEVFTASQVWGLFVLDRGENNSSIFFKGILFILSFFFISGFKVIKPNGAIVATFFGKYSGTLAESGFFWINPLYSIERISLKTHNHITPILKVNDGNGNPIEIAAAVVWHISRPASAVYDVENIGQYIQAQCESALRALASNHPYEGDSPGKPSLRLHADDVVQELVSIVQERLIKAGVQVDEVRFTHLAYAPEIAQAMLRKQQAQSIVAARATIVEGAVSMVESAVKELETREIVKLDQKDRARLVTNMLTVLLSEEGARPVISISTNSESN